MRLVTLLYTFFFITLAVSSRIINTTEIPANHFILHIRSDDLIVTVSYSWEVKFYRIFLVIIVPSIRYEILIFNTLVIGVRAIIPDALS